MQVTANHFGEQVKIDCEHVGSYYSGITKLPTCKNKDVQSNGFNFPSSCKSCQHNKCRTNFKLNELQNGEIDKMAEHFTK